MTVTVTKNLTDLYNAESTSGWTTDDAVSTYSGFQREGSYCLGMQGSQGTVYAYKTITSTNLSNTVIYSWMNAGSVATKANGGFRIVVGDGTNRRAYYVGGSDDYGFQIGAWSCFVLDTASPPTSYSQEAGSSAPNFSAVTQIGVMFNVPIKAVGSGDNVFFDICRYGTGITITGGTSGDEVTLEQVADDDASTASGKAYGIIREIQTGVYGVQGRLTFGDGSGTGTLYFKDTDSILIYENRDVPDTHYKLSVVGNSTGTTSFILGNKVGSGDTALGANGVTIRSAGPGLEVDLSGANVNTIGVYGCSFLGVSHGITLNSNTAHEFIGNTVDQCGQVDPKQTIVRNCVFSGTTDSYGGTNPDGSALLWNSSINIKNCDLRSNAHGTYDPHAIQHDTAGTFTYDNLVFASNDYDIHFTAASGDLVINATNGANPGTYDIEGTGSVTINNAVTLKVTVKNEAGDTISDAQTAIFKLSDDTQLMNKDTDANGIASTTYNYTADTDVYIRVRKSSPGGTRYEPYSSTGLISSAGLNVIVTLKEDSAI